MSASVLRKLAALLTRDAPQQADPIHDGLRQTQQFGREHSVIGFASGGLVYGAKFPTDDFDPARIDAIVDELHAMNAA